MHFSDGLARTIGLHRQEIGVRIQETNDRLKMPDCRKEFRLKLFSECEGNCKRDAR